MPTQRHEEKRVEERASAWERERKSTYTQKRQRERKRFGSSFYMFFLPLGLPYANWA